MRASPSRPHVCFPFPFRGCCCSSVPPSLRPRPSSLLFRTARMARREMKTLSVSVRLPVCVRVCRSVPCTAAFLPFPFAVSPLPLRSLRLIPRNRSVRGVVIIEIVARQVPARSGFFTGGWSKISSDWKYSTNNLLAYLAPWSRSVSQLNRNSGRDRERKWP